MRGRGVILALALALAAQALSAAKVIVVDVDGVVHPITTEIVSSAIARAKQENAALLVVRLNTPGGLMEAMRETIQQIVSSPVPVVTYVAPSGGRAASAGFFILESGDVAAMAPGTNTGAAHPVAMFGEMDAEMKEKVENDAAAYMRSICTKRGRNSAVAETAVRESKSFTEKEALDQHLVDLIAPSETDLLRELDGRTVTRFDGQTVTLHTAGADDRSLRAIAAAEDHLGHRRPEHRADSAGDRRVVHLRGILLAWNGGAGSGGRDPGAAGLSALSVLPINWLGAALLLLAFTLFALEAKFAAHGVSGRGRRGLHGAGRGDAGQQPVPGNAQSIGARPSPWRCPSRSSRCCCSRWRCARAAIRWQTGSEGMIGEIGYCLHRPRAGGQSIRARRILERDIAGARGCRRARPGQQPSTD